MTKRPILVLNCGSSSIKFALYDGTQTPLPRTSAWQGKVQGIGTPIPQYEESGQAAANVELDQQHPHTAALELILDRVQQHLKGQNLFAVAHRVVHGGPHYFEPVVVNQVVIDTLRSYTPLAPLHQPFPLKAMAILLQRYPQLKQVACFDTAFHRTIPAVEQTLPLPYSAWQKGIRRYGFHGLSYDYLSQRLPEVYGELAKQRLIIAHLGNGASLCALNQGKSVATTMGFSALDGLMMGTRTGAIDPGALLYLLENEKLSLSDLSQMLYHESGLLGVSGLSSEPRYVVQHETAAGETGERARLALALYVRRIVREIGALTAVLGGLDLLVFTAGVGENCAFIRERVCSDLSFLNLKIDADANNTHQACISSPDSAIVVAIEPTNEEWVAAKYALQLLATR